MRISDFRVRKLKSSYFLFRNPQSAFRNRSTLWSRWPCPFFRYLWLGCLFGCLSGSFFLSRLWRYFLGRSLLRLLLSNLFDSLCFHSFCWRWQKAFGPKFLTFFFPFSPPCNFPIPFTSRHRFLPSSNSDFACLPQAGNVECGRKRKKISNLIPNSAIRIPQFIMNNGVIHTNDQSLPSLDG